MGDKNEERSTTTEEKQFQQEQESDGGWRDIKDFFEKMRGSSESGNFVFVKNMNFWKNNSNVVVGDQVDMEEVVIQGENEKNDKKDIERSCTSKENVVEERERLTQWLAEHYNDFEMAFLVSLAVFESSPYLWVAEVAEELFQRMDGDKEGEWQKKVRVPNNQRIEVSGAKIYNSVIHNHTGLVECEFICFQKPEYRKRVLECVWKEFMFFRETLIGWLEKYVFYENYTKKSKAVKALAELALLDYYYFENHVIRTLLTEKNFVADYAVAQIMACAYMDERYRKNVEIQMAHWAALGNIHYSLIALLMCAMGEWEQERVQLAVEAYIKRAISELRSEKQSGYLDNLDTFFEIGGRKAVYFKSIVSILYEKLQANMGRRYREDRECIGGIFLLLLWRDFAESHIDVVDGRQNKDMIFVKMCFIKNEVTPKLLELWKFIWKNRNFHKLTQALLEQYLYQYGGCGEVQIQYLRQFLYSFQESERERGDMEFFLRKISLKNRHPVKTAERINH